MTARRFGGRGLILPLLLAAAWETASRSGLPWTHLLPSLVLVVERAWTGFIHGDLAYDVAVSLGRTAAGFAIGSILGLTAGLALGLSRVVERLAGPLFDGLKQIALFAWVPLISVWFGVGEVAKIAFIALGAFTPMVVNAWEGVRTIDPRLVELGRVSMLGPVDRLRLIILPGALPSIFAGLHLSLIYAWLATVGAEYFMTIGAGIGSLMMDERERYRMDLVLMCMILLGLVGYSLNRLAAHFETRLLHWRAGEST